MEIVLGVSMDSTAIRMVLVEGEKADGVTVDHDTIEIPAGAGTAASRAANQVVLAILGTRESALEGGHRLVSAGVAWSDHAAAAHLRDSLREHGLDDVVLASELHAAGALAQAIGQAVDCDRTALVFLDGDTATLAVVQTSDGAVVKVESRDADALPDMVAGLETLDEPPQAVFVMGPGLGASDTEAVRARVADRTVLPVHAPQDAHLALARGAALASAHTPRFEAETAGLAPAGLAPLTGEQTAAGLTQMAPAGYMAPLGYSAVPDEDDADLLAYADESDPEPSGAEHNHFLLVGSALSAIFVAGVAALVISLAVSVRPAVDQRQDPGQTAGQTEVAPASPAPIANPVPAPAPQTIQAPIPVVQQAPRTVYVVPAPKAPVVETVAPAAVPVESAPAAPAPQPAPAAPAPVPVAPPVVAPIVPPWLRGPQLPSIFMPPGVNVPPAQAYPPQQTYPSQQMYPSSPVYPSTPSTQSGGQGESGSDSSGYPVGPQSRGDRRNPLWPTWPPFG